LLVYSHPSGLEKGGEQGSFTWHFSQPRFVKVIQDNVGGKYIAAFSPGLANDRAHQGVVKDEDGERATAADIFLHICVD